MLKVVRRIVCVAGATLGAIAVAGAFTINRSVYVDLQSGRLRETREVFGVIVDSRIVETTFSRLATCVGAASQGEEVDWKISSRKNAFDHHSAYYEYHVAPAAFHHAALYIDQMDGTKETREALVREALAEIATTGRLSAEWFDREPGVE